MDSLDWSMDWGAGTIYDAIWVAGIFGAMFYAIYIRAVDDSIPTSADCNQDVKELPGIFQPTAIETSVPAERHESAI